MKTAYFKFNHSSNGAVFTIIEIDLKTFNMLYADRSSNGFKVWGKLFLDTNGEEYFKSTAYDGGNKDHYPDKYVQDLPEFNVVKPILFELLKLKDMLVEPSEKIPEGEIPF